MIDSLKPGEPAWRIALFFPQQGGWTEDDYFGLENGPLVEYDGGFVEIQDMPTKEHQRMVQFLFVMFRQFSLTHRCGETFIAPLPVRLWPKKFREPDVVYVRRDRGEYKGYPDGADLVVEVVSPGESNRRRDLQTKKDEYARAGVLEYWTIDPETQLVTVHALVASSYSAITYSITEIAVSQTLQGFSLSVKEIFGSALPQ